MARPTFQPTGGISRRAAAWTRRSFAGLALALALVATGAAAQTWRYVLGEIRVNQQANFCASMADIDDVATVFERFGPRTGYSALANSPGCALQVHDFTPEAVVRELTITPAAAPEYTIRFVRVRTALGEQRFLVTTREVADP